MFEIALNKCTVLLSTTGLEENIPTIEALIWAQRAVPQQPRRRALPPVSQHPLLDRAGTAALLLLLTLLSTFNSASTETVPGG